ncbi:MAG: DNA polymerase III subunit delta [Acidobacteria bacterium]|mgnify:CR=1 FL=1|nr:MAG: DNA polymerase III subunit delta [Acidobacteriota bacterium]REK01232.1 MAG: DNA polymerase III subunit delta [Acidobacteriota bacterium]REK14188.1 MAG: DNA polymerase III subunit delta [Acidobacteriota bacterium]REK44903.1 MAG: DNA polymerase III subunit delta [Acidobacteriota bacterium]
MKILAAQDLRNSLRRKEIAPVYLLFGPEGYQRNLAAQAISDIALKGAHLREFNESEISLNAEPVGSAIAASEQLPMMADKRVVRVTDVVISTNKQACNFTEEDAEAIESYLKDPSGSTVLILVADEIDKRLKAAKVLIEHCTAVEFSRLAEPELVAFAKDKLKDLDATAEENVVKEIVAHVGDDLRKLSLEIEKLAVAAYPDGVITRELVEHLVPNSRELTNFELTDHLLENRKTRALQVLKKILDDGAEPLMLLGLIGSNFHRLLLAKELMNEGVPRSEVVRSLRLPYKKQEPFLALARKTEREKFSEILKKIADTDLAIKTSLGTPRMQIEMLVCELASMH